MPQEEYRSCMTKKMGGGRLKGLSKEDRRIEFCSIAKECSKGLPYEEARTICVASVAEAAANPKPPKARKTRGACKIDSDALASCILKGVEVEGISQADLPAIISNCTRQKIEKTQTRERFIKKCFKENAITGDIKEAQKLRSFCATQWKEQETAA